MAAKEDSTSLCIPGAGLPVVVEITFGTTRLEEHINIFNCTNIRDPPASVA